MSHSPVSWVLFYYLALSCSRPAGFPRPDGSAEPDVERPSSAPTGVLLEAPEPSAQPVMAPPGMGEARRALLGSLEATPLLRPFLGILRDHFGAGRGPFAVQDVDLAGGRAALLVSRAPEAEPMVLTVDRDELAWAKPRPLAGITPPAMHATIAPRPDGGVALFVYVAALHILAARMWADDGNPYAEIELASFDACDALSAGYAPAFGWVIACTSRFGTHAQRLREDGTTAWGPEGTAIGAPTAAGPATIAFDTPTTWMLLQRAKGAGADHLLAWRYDSQAWPLWPAPVDVGGLHSLRAPAMGDRFDASTAREGAVRVDLSQGLSGKSGMVAEIASSGDVRVVSR